MITQAWDYRLLATENRRFRVIFLDSFVKNDLKIPRLLRNKLGMALKGETYRILQRSLRFG